MVIIATNTQKNFQDSVLQDSLKATVTSCKNCLFGQNYIGLINAISYLILNETLIYCSK